MDLTQLFRELSYGELANLSLGNDGNGTIRAADQPRIIQFANEALLRLYTRFILKENDVLVELVDWITNYHLLGKFAESQAATSPQDTLYIKDLMRETFTEDVIRILTVVDSFGVTLPLNDPEHIDSVFTPQGNVLQVPNPVGGTALSVLYQAKHPTLSNAAPLVLTQEIVLPEVLWEAFRAYIAHRVYTGINTQEAVGIAQTHFARYEAICQDVVDKDLVSTSLTSTNARFNKNGWC